jgi:hypothetical protein
MTACIFTLRVYYFQILKSRYKMYINISILKFYMLFEKFLPGLKFTVLTFEFYSIHIKISRDVNRRAVALVIGNEILICWLASE